jgi:hypothetical protein
MHFRYVRFTLTLIRYNSTEFCRERAVTVPRFAVGKSKFMFGESIQQKINHTACDSEERSQPVPYMRFSNLTDIKYNGMKFYQIGVYITYRMSIITILKEVILYGRKPSTLER